MTEGKRKITIDDLYEMKFVTDPQISPDGKMIAYVVKKVDKDDDTKYQNHIYVVNTDGSNKPVQFTSLGKSETNPRWSPDGKFIAFNAKYEDNKQIYKVPVEGGAPLLVTNNDFDAGVPVWSPDGNKIAFSSKVFPEDYEKSETDVKYIDNLRYKFNGTGFYEGKVNQIHMVDVSSCETTQITKGEYPCSDPTWSPCSKYIAFSSNRTEDHEYNRFSDIYI